MRDIPHTPEAGAFFAHTAACGARKQSRPVLEGGYARFVKGGADNPKMEMFGNVVLDMARKAAELARTTKLY